MISITIHGFQPWRWRCTICPLISPCRGSSILAPRKLREMPSIHLADDGHSPRRMQRANLSRMAEMAVRPTITWRGCCEAPHNLSVRLTQHPSVRLTQYPSVRLTQLQASTQSFRWCRLRLQSRLRAVWSLGRLGRCWPTYAHKLGRRCVSKCIYTNMVVTASS